MKMDEFLFYLFGVLGTIFLVVGLVSENDRVFKSGIVVFLSSVSFYMMITLP